jgi:hypothetical protein
VVGIQTRTHAAVIGRKLELLKHNLVAILLQLLWTIRLLGQQKIGLLWITLPSGQPASLPKACHLCPYPIAHRRSYELMLPDSLLRFPIDDEALLYWASEG